MWILFLEPLVRSFWTPRLHQTTDITRKAGFVRLVRVSCGKLWRFHLFCGIEVTLQVYKSAHENTTQCTAHAHTAHTLSTVQHRLHATVVETPSL